VATCIGRIFVKNYDVKKICLILFKIRTRVLIIPKTNNIMKKSTLIILALAFIVESFAQGIGRLSINFRDPSRTGGFSISGAASFPAGSSGRNIGTEIYYPATSTGANAPIVPGEYPVIVFGHGFAMAWDAYQNIWENLVPRGYIVAFPRTEGSLIPAPSHSDFGRDLALVETLIQQMGTTSGNILFGNVSANGAIMGHSMGGGSSFLAGANNTSPTLRTIVGLAPAETNPSAITAAASVTVDIVVLSGSADGVTPPASHHIPIYNAAASSCKFFFSLIGGGHCRFANANFNCDFGESSSGGPGSLTRAQVHGITYNIINPWLDFKLKGICSGWSDFQNFISTGANISVTQNCNYDVIPNVQISPAGPLSDCQGSTFLLESPLNPDYTYQWFNQSGPINGATQNTYTTSSSGNFYLQATSAFNCSSNSNTVDVTFNPIITPTFSLPNSVCEDMTPPPLPTTSNNGITGTWNPSFITNTQSGTYTFTPSAGQCANNFVLNVTLANNDIVPVFNQIPPVCFGEAAPALPAVSVDNITGSWNPSTISNTSSGTYTFTPDPGQCATTTTMQIEVIIASSTPVNASICEGETFQLSNGNTVNTAGSYIDTVLSTQGCDSLYRNIELTVIDSIFILSVEGLSPMQPGETGNFYVITNLPYTSINWAVTDGTIMFNSENADTAIIAVHENTIIEVEVNNGCTNSASLEVSIVSSLRKLSDKNNFRIYPNPARDMITIDFGSNTNTHETEITVFNILGKTVIKQNISEQNKTINVSLLPNGFYTIMSDKGTATFIKAD
jgi:dienelactone hydrolase